MLLPIMSNRNEPPFRVLVWNEGRPPNFKIPSKAPAESHSRTHPVMSSKLSENAPMP
jgi:hypothetical protein